MGGIISHVQRFSLHDGPGVRTTVFFMNCPLRCRWCHNPETLSGRRGLTYRPDKCIHCLGCAAVCPSGALTADGEGLLAYDPALCRFCFACADACPPRALTVAGQETGAEELLRELLRDRTMYGRTGGGITFSGGEPTMQSAFLNELLDLCAGEGIHTAVDTCGLCDGATFLALCRKARLVLFDLKHMDSARHRELTGAPNEHILENARALSENGVKMDIRVPVVPGCNDDEDNLDATAEFVGTLSGVERVALLGYHKLGLSKSYGFGLRQEDTGLESPSAARMQALCERFQKRIPGIPVSYR